MRKGFQLEQCFFRLAFAQWKSSQLKKTSPTMEQTILREIQDVKQEIRLLRKEVNEIKQEVRKLVVLSGYDMTMEALKQM
jgi:hypothetical protein